MTSTASIPIPDLSENLSQSTTALVSQTHILPPPFHHTNPAPALLTQGAEALVYKTTFISSSTPAALKYRPSKPYRHPTLDARLTKSRVLAEARVLVRLSGLSKEGIVVPAVLSLEWDVGRKVKGLSGEQKDAVAATRTARGEAPVLGVGAWLLMEWIEGKSVKQLLRDWDAWYKNFGQHATVEVRNQAEEDVRRLLRRVGKAVAAMHSKGAVVHGDLTSSNIMVRPLEQKDDSDAGVGVSAEEAVPMSPSMEGEIVLIDFGLAMQSIQEEDRAVDLYVLERAFGSTHPRQERLFNEEVLQSQDGYRGTFKGSNNILKRLEDVRMRGRKRTMIG